MRRRDGDRTALRPRPTAASTTSRSPGSYLAKIDPKTGKATVIAPPTPDQGARRVWSDSLGRLWISEWNAGKVGMYDPAKNQWKEWRAPGEGPKIYSIFVDEKDRVWVSDFGANAFIRFDPAKETFEVIPIPSAGAAVRQMLGRPGEIWGAESGPISSSSSGPSRFLLGGKIDPSRLTPFFLTADSATSPTCCSLLL